MRSRRWTAAVLGLSLLAAACSSDDSSGPEDDDEATDEAAEAADTAEAEGPDVAFPGAEWETIDPVEAGFDPAKLEEIAAAAEADGSYCFLVVRHGRLVGEWYWGEETPTTPHEVFSATKSYASTLVGLAQADGLLDIDDKASKYIPEWVGTESEDVTVRDLLSNDSGRHWDFQTDYQGLVGAADRTQFGIDLGQDAPPDTVWAYNNSAIQTLDAVLDAVLDQTPAEYAEERIFEPLGMADTDMTTDGAGNTNMFFGLQSTCRDMARFGHLFLQEGRWGDEQVVPAEWVEEAVGAPSQELNAAYGLLWWLNRNGPQPNTVAATDPNGGPSPDGQAVPGAPEDMYWAHGLGNQLISVDPGSGTVAVRLGTGNAGAAGQPGAFGRHAIARVVTEALVDTPPDADAGPDPDDTGSATEDGGEAGTE
ncbi:MAG TPA: serine hydrolase domain-containing protein [Acidimicrobiales bacterium]